MKFKHLKIEDTAKRQSVLANESDKEVILYNEPITWDAETNSEFVIGLPLDVREYNEVMLKELAYKISEQVKKLIPSPYVVAIHSKKLEDEVHFHLSYQNIDVDHDKIKAVYENLG